MWQQCCDAQGVFVERVLHRDLTVRLGLAPITEFGLDTFVLRTKNRRSPLAAPAGKPRRRDMHMIRFAFALLIGIGIAAPVALTASDEAVPSKAVVKAAQAGPLAALKGVKAVPMSAGELDAVKGQHVHFLTLSNGKIHLAGDVKTENNWSSDWGGTDGQPVAPSYKGLCVAHGNGSIFIPTGPPGTPVTLQCPAGS